MVLTPQSLFIPSNRNIWNIISCYICWAAAASGSLTDVKLLQLQVQPVVRLSIYSSAYACEQHTYVYTHSLSHRDTQHVCKHKQHQQSGLILFSSPADEDEDIGGNIYAYLFIDTTWSPRQFGIDMQSIQ